MRKSSLVVSLALGFLGVHSVTASAAVGRTQGSFSVSNSGAATYAVPIWSPPGINGIQPRIALTYSSQDGDGYLGVGWSLSGLGSIYRCNRTFAQDGSPGAVTLSMNDVFCINGNRLRSYQGSYGASGSTYQTEIADFSLITANGVAGNGPASFTVRGKDGLIYTYGGTSDSQVLANGSSTASTWMLSQVADRSGNTMSITYSTNDKATGTVVPATISWTANSAQSISAAYQIIFNYGANVAQSVYRGYVAGTAVKNANLLSSIYVQNAAGSVSRAYFLGYRQGDATGRSQLNQIQECADTSQSDCFTPTVLTYKQGQSGLISTGVRTSLDDPYDPPHAVDLDGDGFTDLVALGAPPNWNYLVKRGSASGYGQEIDTQLSSGGAFGSGFGFADLLGTGKAGTIGQDGGNWVYFTLSGSTFVPTSTVVSPQNPDENACAFFADANGDGLPDFIGCATDTLADGVSPATLRVYIHLNTSSNGVLSFATRSLAYEEFVGGAATVGVSSGGTTSAGANLRKFDFNGDGREDLVVAKLYSNPCECVAAYTVVEVLTSNSSGYAAATLPNQASNSPLNSWLPVNWNNDNCTDLMVENVLYVSGCDGTFAAYSLPGIVSAVVDWDGDGRQDVLVYGGATTNVYLSTEQGFSSPISTGIPGSHCVAVVSDFDGDGLDDLTCWEVSDLGSATGFITSYSHNGAGTRPDLLDSVTDGFGVVVSPTYVPISQSNYDKYSDGSYPDRDYVGPLYVVNQFTATDGIGGTYSQQFWYYGARINLRGRGFDGFYAKRTHDSRNSFYLYDYFRRDFPFTGMPVQSDLYQSDIATLISHSTNGFDLQTLDATANNQRYFPFVNLSSRSAYEFGGFKNGQLISTTNTTFGYDGFGNATNVSTTVTDGDSAAPISPNYGLAWTTTTVTTISPDTGNWCLGLPSSVTVTNGAPSVPNITRTVNFPSPDYVKCREAHKVTEPSSSTYAVTEDYGFDGFGNVNSVTVTGAGMIARTTSTNWGPRGQFPMSTTNALNETTYFDYDFNVGQRSSLIDPNNVHAAWLYDSFGRMTRETRPDNTYTTWAYLDCANAGGCLYGSHSLVVIPSVYNNDNSLLTNGAIFFDQFDRQYFEDHRNLDGTYTRIDMRYDNLGRVHQRSMPCTYVTLLTPCTNWTTLEHDVLGREISETRPTSGTNPAPQSTTITYEGLTTTITDPQNKKTVKVGSVAGTMVQSKDHNNYYQNFVYDAFGSLLTVTDSLSNTLQSNTYAYGVGAFKIGTTDMDLGSWGYTINALGETKAYVDANGSNFSATYDDLSRPLTRSVTGEGQITFTYGHSAASFNIGKLQSVSQVGGPSETYTYDSTGRLTNRHIVSDAAYDYDYGYHATTGLLDTMTYPTSTSSYRLKLQYNYQNGILNQVKDFNSSTVFWTLNSTNARGQVLQETLGNGLITRRDFDAVTGWLSSIQCNTTATGGCVQNQSYLYDLVGNLIQRQNNNLTLTENFCYDDVYRLDHTTSSASCPGTPVLQMHYDAMGNITSRNDIASGATWTYSPTHRHQVTQAGDSSHTYGYDANGNAITRNGASITWSKYNYPTVINGSGESTNLYYDATNARWKQVYTQGGATETSIYIGNKLEKVTANGVTDYRYYIYANGQAVAIMSRTSAGANTTRYLLRDALGSVSKITDSTGAEVVNESFTAFGARRNPLTWSSVPTNGDMVAGNAVTREGYTGHDALGSMGLNHMNGRVQDAITGRFLSADPLISDPGNTQNFNRYSYVYNNPLSYVDPSGFEGCGLTSDVEGCPEDQDTPSYQSSNSYSDTYTGSHIPGVIAGNVSCVGDCLGFNLTQMGYEVTYRDVVHTITSGGALLGLSFVKEVYAGKGQTAQSFVGSYGNYPASGIFPACQDCFRSSENPNFPADIWAWTHLQSINDPPIQDLTAQATLLALSFTLPGRAVAIGEAAAARGVSNAIPSTLARVIPGKGPFPTLGPASRSDVFVTAADDIAGMNATQLSQRLGIPSSDTFTIVRFPTPQSGLASPINRLDPGFIGGGRTIGGAREFVVPNGPIPSNSVIEVVGQ